VLYYLRRNFVVCWNVSVSARMKEGEPVESQVLVRGKGSMSAQAFSRLSLLEQFGKVSTYRQAKVMLLVV
jgi:hypothetical protein